MATILGSCGCGCGGGCESVTSNCNFVLRKYAWADFSGISWTGEATDEEKECIDSGSGNCGVVTLFDVCTGEGELRRSGGGGGSSCPITTDEGPIIYPVPCCTNIDLIACGSTFYNIYDEGSQTGELFNGDITFNGVIYNISGGIISVPPNAFSASSEDSVVLMSSDSSDVGITQASSGTILGTFTVSYTDESIDFDNIGEVELTENEAGQPSPPCKFSYNFSFTPEDGADYYVMAIPCDSAAGYITVNLAADGRAYFNSSYNETTKLCSIVQTQVLAPPDTDTSDTNAPESQ